MQTCCQKTEIQSELLARLIPTYLQNTTNISILKICFIEIQITIPIKSKLRKKKFKLQLLNNWRINFQHLDPRHYIKKLSVCINMRYLKKLQIKKFKKNYQLDFDSNGLVGNVCFQVVLKLRIMGP